MRYIVLLMTLFLFTGCSRCSVSSAPDWLKLPCMDYSYFRFPWSADEDYCTEEKNIYDVDEQALTMIVWSYATEMKHDYHLRLEDSKVYIKDGSITKFRLYFTTQNIVTLCEARELLVDVTERMLDHVTNDDVIAGYLPTDFSYMNMEIYINLESYMGMWVDPDYVGWIILQDGLSFFYDQFLKDYTAYADYPFWHQRVEQYYKSREIVTYQREAESAYQEVHQTKETSKLKNVELYDNTIQNFDTAPQKNVIHDQ